MTYIAAIDPGTDSSALLIYDPKKGAVRRTLIADNIKIRNAVYALADESMDSVEDGVLLIEKMESYGNVIGRSILETSEWSGRFAENYRIHSGGNEVVWITRRDVKLTLVGTMRAGDAHVRQALLDKFPDGGVGTKKHPGPLYGVKSHLWQALALVFTYIARHGLASDWALRPSAPYIALVR